MNIICIPIRPRFFKEGQQVSDGLYSDTDSDTVIFKPSYDSSEL